LPRPARTFALLAVAGLALCARPAAADMGARADSLLRLESRVRWEPGAPESALARARRDSLPAYLDFYATWCAPCRWMDRVVYPDPLLADASEGVRMIRVDIDSPAGKALAARYDVQAYPTLVFVAGDGHEQLRWVGPLNLRDTRLDLAQVSVPTAQRAALLRAVAARPDDAGLVATLVTFYAYRGEVENARAAAAFARRTTAATKASDRAAVELALGKAEEFGGRDDNARAAYGRVLLLDPRGLWAWRAWLGLSACHERQGETDAAIDAAQHALALRPRTPWLAARAERLALRVARPTPPPGVDDGPGHP